MVETPPDAVLQRLARRANELAADEDALTGVPVARWAWATPYSSLDRAEPLYAERHGLAPGELCPERPAGEADRVGYDASGRVVAVHGYRLDRYGEPRLLEERLRWPVAAGERELAYVERGRFVAIGYERDDAAGRLEESWVLWTVRHWRRERYAYDAVGRLVSVDRLDSIATPEARTPEPVATRWVVHRDAAGEVERIDHHRTG